MKVYKKEKPNPENKDWLKNTVHDYFNPVKEEKRSDLIADCITYVIDTANVRENNKKGLGLSTSRINSYKNLLKIIEKYQKGKNPFKVKDVDIRFGKNFLNWLINKQYYSESYARKKVDDLKTVCRDAEIDGIETSTQLNKVKGGKPQKEHIIYLSPQELEKIEKTHIINPTLQNARKWLLFGCHIGQRGSDLLKITESNFVIRQGLEVIELKQKKTGKNITIPILDKTKEILSNGLPRKISIQNLNNYFKEVCKVAGIDHPTKGSKILMVDKNGKEIPKDEKGNYIEKGVKRTITGIYPKHELISTHVCRRSFATNLYGTLPTALIMQITAHSTEKMFLKYIGKNSLDYAQQIADFYELQKIKKDKEPQLNVIKNVSSH
ncbi:tyrosine-type recombinase/integrase [Mesonia mobilis]|uniref:Transposase n=1 Tax=Mesonia mobilis TaxID=369791 RepID=A0ABQ3BHW7_9FLAO|nr:site-specific integrase [Mesonia mobilis]MBQ0737504.1 phage integrase SAM-like domain-containing protein [Aquimarina celericrescens]GGZ45960.1 transposase [Mesonia mobilis]